METAKLFENGRSQAVSLPKAFRFSGNEVYIQKIGDSILLTPKDKLWENFLTGLNAFSADFMESGREDEVPSERESL